MKFTWTLRLAVLNPLLVILSIMMAGAGHGSPMTILLLYPLTFLSGAFDGGGGPLLWIIFLFQIPLYGLIIDLGNRFSLQSAVSWLLVILHMVLAVIAVASALPSN
ncbi:MAG TPA: hypothetical protein PLX35_03605 [Cyclobacteriaceae bacterium]|nr:hypothetical protein [Cyclobacteriaceae bacterium]